MILIPGCTLGEQNFSADFLALGDSYTIGQSVQPAGRWPQQFLDNYSLEMGLESVEYRAVTGWTTGNLLASLESNPPEGPYQMVSLLIGVNNQFRGLDFSTYTSEVPRLVDLALDYAGGKTESLVILSIPDYAYTPYGLAQSSSTRSRISSELNQYNAWMEAYAQERGILFVDITPITRRGLQEPELVAEDGLHPSALAYGEFAQRLWEELSRR